MTQEEWLAIKNCDKEYDGLFFYALKTTKTVCRPSCTARTPNPKNVLIFNSVDDAINEGYRPCNRCRPDYMEWKGAKEELSIKAKQYIEVNYSEKFSLKEIAKKLYVNPYYLHRTFKDTTSYTLLWYHNFVRIEMAKVMLKNTQLSISFIAFEVGYNSLSHFSRAFKKLIGCSPSVYRNFYRINRE